MSGGISAIKGFDYQAVVILSRLFDHFDRHGASALARPEGIDDLDLIWVADGVEHRRYEQIKKPAEDQAGNLNPTPWTLARAIDELLPNTVAHLSGNDHSQIWIVGDTVHRELESLIAAGANAPSTSVQAYWMAAHGLARIEAIGATGRGQPLRQKLGRWRPPADLPADSAKALSRIAAEFGGFAEASGAADAATYYRQRIAKLHACLPNVLARTQILAGYGSEQDVAKAVIDRLEQTYLLQRRVIENCLFRNLTGFINDIAKQPGRSFDHVEFEFELRSVWPHMLPIREPPALSSDHIARRDLVKPFTTGWTGKAVEAVGISGSGKTMLATEVVDHSRHVEPARQVYYAEVRGQVSLRDVLVGVAFHLRRLDITKPFVVSVQCGPAEEEALARLARAYSALSQEVSLLIDLVDGTCSLAFARDLATFVRALSPSAFRIAVLGQESGLRELTAAERQDHDVMRLDLRGFRLEEFVLLVKHHHADADWAVLQNIYYRVTAGRPVGLFAKLANSLARAASLEEMSAIAARPADEILANSEQQRFARISSSARSAAEKLVCFALPFRLRDAEEVFPDDNVGAAIRELLMEGLLRVHAEDSFEMHETVRAGLEGMIAPNVRRTAHTALAAWYWAQGITTARILHLEHAGSSTEAQQRARETFLRGECWSALAAYVTGHKLVSARELVSTLAGTNPVKDRYLFSSLLRDIGEPAPIDELLRILRGHPERFLADYQWGLAIVEAILDFEPERLHDLILFALETASQATQRESALTLLLIAARRKNGVIGPRTAELFGGQPPEMKRLLVRFLLLGWRREAMRPALQFLIDDPGFTEGPQRRSLWHGLALQVGSRDNTVEFLAAMPAVEATAMLTAKSALLGPLAALVWAQRQGLRSHSIDILREGAAEETVLINAMRVLIFLAEPSISALCGPLMSRKDGLGVLARLMPALVPSSCDRALYEARLLDCGVAFEDRMMALFVLAAAGAEMGSLYRRVRGVETDPKKAELWEFGFLMLCNQAPFPEAIPLLEKRLEAADAQATSLLIPILMKLGELPVPSAMEMLTRSLSHSHPRVRQCAAVALTQRRSRTALPSLIDRYAKEDIEALAVGLATAIVASGPKSVADLSARRHASPATQLWQCILAMRLRDVTFADRLVAFANDRAQNWQLRRAAIFAAGRLPYDTALGRIAPVVLAERSPLTVDGNMDLLCHAVVWSTLLYGADDMAPMFARGRAGFVAFFAEHFEESWKGTLSRQGLPTGVDTARWLFDRLGNHGWSTQRGAPDAVLNEISAPMLHSAVLRSLRLSGRPDLIEEQLPTAYHPWFAMKCLLERSRAGMRDPGLTDRLKSLVDASPHAGDARLHRVAAEIGGGPPTSPPSPARPSAGADQTGSAPPVTYLGYDEVARVLSGADADFKPAGTIVLKSLDAGQCERLIKMADPINDPNLGVETYVPSVEFKQNGHIVARREVTYAGGGEMAQALIRPAVAAANSFGLPNPWHKDLLTGPLSVNYIPKYLACLSLLDDSDRFYEELGRDEDILMPLVGDVQLAKPVLKYVDGRIAPFLMRHVFSGTDDLFEGLCTLALQVDAPEIDPVLAGLLYRFTRRFNVSAPALQHSDNRALWCGFDRLAEHPRFTLIEGWPSSLASVLQAPMMWFRAQNIVRVLERDPRSYVLIESRLLRAENWAHLYRDEIDRLDDAGERLFRQLLET